MGFPRRLLLAAPLLLPLLLGLAVALVSTDGAGGQWRITSPAGRAEHGR